MTIRPLVHLLLASILTACGARTPPCTDDAVTTEVLRIARAAIEENLRKNEREVQTGQIMSTLNLRVQDIATASHEKSIDKFNCTANLHVGLPAEVAALKDHRAFRAYTQLKADLPMQGNDIVAPVTYSSYLSEKNETLIVDAEGVLAPARFIQGAHKAGVFSSDLASIPDLHAGSTHYSAKGKSLLIRPNAIGGLEFHMAFENRACHPWNQVITEEKGSTLVYDNPSVRCTVIFSRLGELLFVEHEGCDLMVEACYPDGIYQKQ